MSEAAALLAAFADVAMRDAAAARLATWLGAEDLLIFLLDLDVSALLPPPGFRATVRGGASFRAFLKDAARPGAHQAQVEYPPGVTQPVLARVTQEGLAFVLVAGTPIHERLATVVAGSPLLAALLHAENRKRVAEGEAAVARAAGRRVIVDVIVFDRERVIRQQQNAIRELSTPVLQIRDRLLLLPIVGVMDTERAKLVTENLLRSIRSSRAKVVVMDVTGVATIDSKVANHLIQTVTAAKLMGASVIVTGLSAEVAQSLVALGIDLTKLNTVGDLQGGVEEAERFLGFKVVAVEADRGGASLVTGPSR